MNTLLSGIFKRSPHEATDGLNQQQREAIIDLLNFCRAADHKLLPAEAAELEHETAAFDWESDQPLNAYIEESLNIATRAIDDESKRDSFLKGVTKRLKTTEEQTEAINFCQKMFMCDGTVSVEEQSIFVEIKKAFGWPL